MSDFQDTAREALERAKEKMTDVAQDIEQKAGPAVDDLLEKAGDLKEKAGPAVDELLEKAAPTIDKVKAGVASVVDKVKDGAELLGDMLGNDSPAGPVKNELFDELGDEVKAKCDAVKSQAEDFQHKIEAMLGGKEETPQAPAEPTEAPQTPADDSDAPQPPVDAK